MHNFVDLQVNGHGGIDFLSAHSEDDIHTASRSLAKNGVGAYLPTLITSDFSQLARAAAFIKRAQEDPREDEAHILGLHLEGPFISHAKCGVHPKNYISEIDLEYAEQLLRVGDIKIMTIAPELDGAIDLIKLLIDRGVVVSLGHSDATAAQAHAGFDAGASTVTHLFNAMSKDGGLAEVARERDDVMIQMIVDDIHVPRELVAEIIEQVGNRFILTNDAVAAAGLGDGSYSFGEMDIVVASHQARRTDGTLAGGVATLDYSLQILADIGVDQKSALASVTTRPLALLN